MPSKLLKLWAKLQVLPLTLSDGFKNLVPNWGNAPKFGAKFVPELLRYFFNGAFLLSIIRLSFGVQIIVSI